MALSRKHFNSLAEMVKRFREDMSDSDLDPQSLMKELVRDLATWCAGHNENFNRQRFLDACEPEGQGE